MSISTPHKHLGTSVRFDELIPAGVIEMRQSTWLDLHQATAHGASTFTGTHEEALVDTSLNASVIGPMDGPDAGTGPLTPVDRLKTNTEISGDRKLPAADHYKQPNALSPTQEFQQNLHAGEPVQPQGPTPYPVGDMPAVPTTTDPHAPQVDVSAEAQIQAHDAKVREDGPDELPDDNQNEQYPADVKPYVASDHLGEYPEHPAIESQPPAEVFADADGKTIGVEDGKGGFEHVRDNPFPPDHGHGDLTGKSIKDHV